MPLCNACRNEAEMTPERDEPLTGPGIDWDEACDRCERSMEEVMQALIEREDQDDIPFASFTTCTVYRLRGGGGGNSSRLLSWEGPPWRFQLARWGLELGYGG